MEFHQILWIGVGIIAVIVFSTLWVEIKKEKKERRSYNK